MKMFRPYLSGVFFLSCFFSSTVGNAQLVSLLVDSDLTKDAQMMEHTLKKFLQIEGYDVKEVMPGEGFFLYVQFMPIKTVREQWKLQGYVGNMFIGSQAWVKVVDSFMPVSCETAKYRKMKNHVGIDMVFLDSQIFSDSSVEGLAAIMSAQANKIIRGKSSEMTALMMQLAEK